MINATTINTASCYAVNVIPSSNAKDDIYILTILTGERFIFITYGNTNSGLNNVIPVSKDKYEVINAILYAVLAVV